MKLTVKQKGRILAEVPIGEEVLTIGRGLDNHLVLEELRASRRHAEVFRKGDACFVRDKGSGNGTYLNDKQIEEAEIKPGDTIRIGQTAIVVSAEEETPAKTGSLVASGMAGLLTVQGGDADGKQFPLLKEQSIIGRVPECDIVLHDARASRENSSVTRGPATEGEGEFYLVKDLESGNGTFVNNVRLSKGEERPLTEGDVVLVGNTKLKYSVVTEEQAQAAVPAAAESAPVPATDVSPGAKAQPGAQAAAEPPRKSASGVIAVVLIALIAGAAIVYFRYFRPEGEVVKPTPTPAPTPPTPAGKKAVPVKVATPTTKTLVEELKLNGEVKAAEEATVTPKLSEKISKIHKKEGDFVEKGALLVELDQSSIRTKILQSEAALEKAKAARQESRASIANLKRQLDKANEDWASMRRLLKDGAVTKTQVDDAEKDYIRWKTEYDRAVNGEKQAAAQVDEAQHALEDVRSNLDHTVVTAPIAGMVSRIAAHAGENVGPGAPLLTILQITKVKVKVKIPEDKTGKVKKGMTAKITSRLIPGKEFVGRVVRLAAELNPADRTLEAQIEVDNPERQLKPGTFPDIVLETGRHENAIVVPRGAIVYERGKKHVFTVKEAKAVVVPVETGLSDGDSIEVIGDLTTDSLIVVDGQAKLKGGEEVKVVTGP